MSNSATAARRSVIYLLDQILGEGRLLPECLAAGALDRLAPEDRARAQRLTIETLRGLERADRLLADHLRQTPALTVHNALRLGTVELCQGEAAHGVVHSMVEIVGRSRKHGRLKGLVNAVLRKIAAEGPDAWPKMRVPRLPEWLRDPLIMAWGEDAVKGMEQAHFNGAPLDLTLKSGPEAPDGEALPTGSVRVRDAGQVSTLPGYEVGNWWVQDAAAALPVQVLAPKAGEKGAGPLRSTGRQDVAIGCGGGLMLRPWISLMRGLCVFARI